MTGVESLQERLPVAGLTSSGSSAKASCLLLGTFFRWYRVSSAMTSISMGLNPSRCSLFYGEMVGNNQQLEKR
jgi:hypothetical protein